MTSPSFSPVLHGLAWGLLVLAASTAQASEPQAVGVVRITKAPSQAVTIRAQSQDIIQTGACKNCERGMSYSHSDGMHRAEMHGPGGIYGSGDHYCDQCNRWHNGNNCGCRDQAILEYFKCKFGYFIPTGNGGAGTPLFGKYARVYPNDPSYFDQRDGQVYGAHGYGVPISVPLAPVVGHQYNYSWGTPASRLTPISRVAPY